MKKRILFSGAATALVTPMTRRGIDYPALGRLIERQITSGIRALVVLGSTGEAATLSAAERGEIIRFAVRCVDGRVPLIAGTGANDTAAAVALSRRAAEEGADGLLLITPYCNKATQKGMYTHFRTVAEAAGLPCLLYNVPGRTGCRLLPETAAALSEVPEIVGIKEADEDFGHTIRLTAACRGRMAVYCGCDDRMLPMLSLGAAGSISVISHLLPEEVCGLHRDFGRGDTEAAAARQMALLPLAQALFCEVNPIPVKAALAALGECRNLLRLPLTPLEKKHRGLLLSRMREAGLPVAKNDRGAPFAGTDT